MYHHDATTHLGEHGDQFKLLLFSCRANENAQVRQEATCGRLPACSSQLDSIFSVPSSLEPFLLHMFSFLRGWVGEGLTAGRVVIFMQFSGDRLLLSPLVSLYSLFTFLNMERALWSLCLISNTGTVRHFGGG